MYNYSKPSFGPTAHQRVAILGNYLPRLCGIATFTCDLAEALASEGAGVAVDVVAMSDHPGYEYGSRVRHQIPDSDKRAYKTAAEFLNNGSYDALSVQHEYGIFGGPDGEHVLSLLREVKVPIVTTLHTVLEDPTENQKAITTELLELSERIVVMSVRGAEILEHLYGASPNCIDLIPHGIPDFSLAGDVNLKERHGIKGLMIFTFGLLSPDKGIQYVIKAMPKILETHADAVYVVLGATHPNVKSALGEAYRESLVALAEEVGVSDSILFIDRFVNQDELVEYLSAADIYATPYLNPRQITSGTLAYALGAGKAVISTPYLYAQELLAEGRGKLVAFRNEAEIAEAVLGIQAHESTTRRMKTRALEYCRPMQWHEVGKQYLQTLSAARNDHALRNSATNERPKVAALHSVTPQSAPTHLVKMTDGVGLFQHANRTVANYDHGYCVDDNARALLLTAYLEADASLGPELSELQTLYLGFVSHSFNELTGRFRNFMSHGGYWLEDKGSDDSHARSLWALGTVTNRCRTAGHQELAAQLFRRSIPAVYEMRSPRSWAFAILAADEYLASFPADLAAGVLCAEMSDRLWREYRVCKGSDWCWFEDVVSYDNPRLSQALIVAGNRLVNPKMREDGLDSLEWLMGHQIARDGCFEPIGSNSFWKRGGVRARFDQQPVEAWASVSACLTALQETGDEVWMDRAECAFEWFLGRNHLRKAVYDPKSGGCRDGIHQDRLNENQGAESTLSFLCSRAEIKSASIHRTPTSGWSLF